MSHKRKISVIGLGYVGLPAAVAFAQSAVPVVGYDIDERRIAELVRGHDRTGEVEPAGLQAASLRFSTSAKDLETADFHIVTVPTPIHASKQPNLEPLKSASMTIGSVLKPGDIVVYESTVYPGVTEEICVPVLEQASGLRWKTDFNVGYSPERINPGDRERRFDNILKIVSADTPETLEIVDAVYRSVVKAGTHRAPSIRVAEFAKVLENTQRDVNIALINEVALICDRLGVDTQDVLHAAGTKWNFLPFRPTGQRRHGRLCRQSRGAQHHARCAQRPAARDGAGRHLQGERAGHPQHPRGRHRPRAGGFRHRCAAA